MVINISQSEHFESGKYLLNKEKVPFYTYPKSSLVYLTQENNISLKNEILNIIKESREVIKVCSFIFTDKDVIEALMKKANDTNVAIFIITQLDQKKLTNKSTLFEFLTEEELKDNSGQTHLRNIKKLFDAGIHIRAASSIHAKFIVTDRNKGFITSANITTPSLNINTESGVYLNEKDAQVLDDLFNKIFIKGTTYRQFLSSVKKNKIFVVQSENLIDNMMLPNLNNSGLRYTLDDQSNNLYNEIISIINGATRFLYISTFSIVKLSKLPDFTNAIKAAISRKVSINIFCRGMNYRNDHLEGSEVLKSLGCSIFADIYNHSKGIINQDCGLIFTANIDGNHGLKGGFEVGCILNENQRNELEKFHKYLIETAYFVYETNPTRIQLFESCKSYEKEKRLSPPRFPDDIIISIEKGVKVNEKEFRGQLIFHGKKGKEDFIICGESFYKCKIENNVFQIYTTEKPRYDLEKYVLKYTNLKIILN